MKKGGIKMGKLFAALSAIVGSIVALTASGACWIVFYEEPTTPKSLLK